MVAPSSQATVNYVTPSIAVDSAGNTGPLTIGGRSISGRYGLIGWQQWGSVATPLATFTGAAAGALTLPTPIVIPANYIPANSAIRCDLHVKRTGATATASLNTRLGTLGTTSDNLMHTVSLAATTLIFEYAQAKACFGTSTTGYFTPLNAIPSGTAAVGPVDRTTNTDTTLPMFLTVDISAANAGDAFALIGISVWLEL